MEVVTTSARATQRIGRMLAQEVRHRHPTGAFVVALEGDLGAGKTAFAQGFARGLGVRERVASPTFVLMNIYPLAKKNFRHFAHVDCYRMASARDLTHLGFETLLKDRDAIILIEWADRVKKIIPRAALRIVFIHGIRRDTRTLRFTTAS